MIGAPEVYVVEYLKTELRTVVAFDLKEAEQLAKDFAQKNQCRVMSIKTAKSYEQETRNGKD